MKKYLSLILVITISFYLGFIYNAAASKRKYEAQIALKRVTGIGGIFFKCKDPKKMRAWYQKHLGFNTDDWGCTFWWKDDKGNDCSTQWSPFKEDTNYFEPSKKEFMQNFRVDNLEELLKK